jgi:cystathionine beta-synthase
MLQYGFLESSEQIRVDEVLAAKHGGHGDGGEHSDIPPIITIGAHDKVRQAIDALHEHDISQAPVVRDASMSVSSFVGSIREGTLLDRLFRDPDSLQSDVAEVMAPPFPMVEFDQPVETAFAELQGSPAVVVTKAGEALGVLTRSDLLEFLAHRRESRG